MSKTDTLIADRYVLQEELGAGGMGTVYKGLDTRTDTPVAIKQLKPDLTTPELIERFKREGEALRDLNHPNIVKMLDTVEENGSHYLVMEYVSGGDLRKLMQQQGRLHYRRCVDMAIDLADALTRAHRLDIIHRDLKPANVLIGEDGTLRLTDFGLAHVGSKKRVTDNNTVMGTIHYMPPEVFRGSLFDERGDIWAFGVMLFEMLAGKHPFERDTITMTMMAITLDPPPDLETLAPNIPTALIDLVSRMLERDPNARIMSVRHVGALLEDIAKGLTTSRIKSGRFETSSLQARAKHNLPAQATSFVGREQELGALDALIREHQTRLITVLGPGGMGKTRLALKAAESALSYFDDGVYLVELAPLSDPKHLTSAIAGAMKYPFQSDSRTPKQQLLDFFSEKSLLLVMDNFEHLLEGADLMSDILHAAPKVKIVATSRERLNLQEETVFRVSGMDFLDWKLPSEALEYSAVTLFLQSARRVSPDFELKPDDLPHVARLCRLVEGMPLGIVLAAAWVDALTLREIAEEISRNINFLEAQTRNTPERHRSIRAVFDYSWALLTTVEQTALMKMSVFRGGFTRDAAEAVGGANLRTLLSLINKSLLLRAVDTGRYVTHELTRQYAASHLDDAGEADATRLVHAEYFASFMRERYLDITGRRQIDGLNEVEADFDNIRAAWGWACQHSEYGMLNRMLDGLYWYHDMRGQYREGVDMLLAAETALAPDHAAGADADTVFHRIRMRRLRHIIIAGSEHIPLEDTRILESLEAARARNDSAETAFCLLLSGTLFHLRGQHEAAVTYATQAHQLYNALGDVFMDSEALVYIAIATNSQGKTVEAIPIMQEALEHKQRIHDVNGVAWASYNYTFFMIGQGNYAEAERSIKRGVENMRRLKTIYGLIATSNALTWLLLIQGRVTEAREPSTQAFTLALEKRYWTGIALASVNLSLVYSILDEAETSEKFFHYLRIMPEELSHSLIPGNIELCFTFAALNAGDVATARAEFASCMKRFILDLAILFPMVLIFAARAMIEASAEQYTRAAEWLAVAHHYPYQNTAWLEDWPKLTRLHADLKTQMGESAFETAWERGKTRPMETVVQELIAEFKDNA